MRTVTCCKMQIHVTDGHLKISSHAFNFIPARHERTEFDSQGWHDILSVRGVVESSTQL